MRSELTREQLWNANYDMRRQIERLTLESETYKRASSYWYVKCQMDRGHKIDPQSSSQHDDDIVREMVAERERHARVEQELERMKSLCKDLIGNEPPFDIEMPR